MSAGRRIEKLRADHVTDGFDCGREDLNRYLVRRAWPVQQAGEAQTYVARTSGGVIVGYHTLALTNVACEDASARRIKGQALYPASMLLLARLAVDRRWQGQGIGKSLLRDAILRTLQAADLAGVVALGVHVSDEEASRFYQRFDFMPSPTDEMHLFVMLKDLRQTRETPAILT